ncbi:MAG: hypothetical protein ACK4LQ_02225 [Pararhodobacter sp.]
MILRMKMLRGHASFLRQQIADFPPHSAERELKTLAARNDLNRLAAIEAQRAALPAGIISFFLFIWLITLAFGDISESSWFWPGMASCIASAAGIALLVRELATAWMVAQLKREFSFFQLF